MAKIYHLKTPRETLELALKFKKDKKFNLFRGQNEGWPLVTSISRLSSSKRDEAVDKLFAFKLFLSEYTFIKEYVESLDHIMAIAQHYGISTDFIDFTYSPEIAIFFATHSNKDLSGKEGVIFCVNKEHFKSTIDLF
ncbi:FRG domain-containing protein [Dysgonomonas sp. HDW5B]|uniref:FRG domain-containing protein n=1 Tax=Dysgonomonas sp. HDW5B TaxID=2714927 RepID=UPI00140C7905|nr:FRG domain-containing protein [Dysgonomonas sp. HDW5B]QIK53793.1 FRG domain-containing protein [Dysgonomonas sp. HDW5B]